MSAASFPIDEVLPELRLALRSHDRVILSAPPGAGKTTRVPPALLDEPWLAGRSILMLEPRRLAARRSADFMAAQKGERPGQTVGYRIRGDSVVGDRTRIEVVTEGILTRMLHADPDLPRTGLLIFDEFHERSIHADLGLALALDVQEHLRSDLKILVMSATLDTEALRTALGDCAVVRSEGKSFPVETVYAGFRSEKRIEERVAETVERALARHEGDVLVFLPGMGEIRRTEEILSRKHLPEDTTVHILHGDLSSAQQNAALDTAPPGTRKVILSSAIAETSLTIDGVRIVIDSGLTRRAEFDPRRGMSGLVTVPVSRASADQRRGRAGRQGPGVCHRIWTKEEQEMLPEFTQPEIRITDLAPLALDLALWGDPEGKNLVFLDPPPAAHFSHARSLLQSLGALDTSGSLTDHGRKMARLPIHPRLAHMILKAEEMGFGSIACDAAAALEEGDRGARTHNADIDFGHRLSVFDGRGKSSDAVGARVRAQASRLRQIMGITGASSSEDVAGILLALSWPERVCRRKEGTTLRFTMVSGGTAVLPAGSLLARHEFLAVGDADVRGETSRMLLAAPIDRDQIVRAFGDRMATEKDVRWNSQTEEVVARSVTRIGAMILDERPVDPFGDEVVAAMVEGIRAMGISSLPWTNDARTFQARSEWVRKNAGVESEYPDVSDEGLLQKLPEFLSPFLSGVRRRSQLAALPLLPALESLLSPSQRRLLDEVAPSHLLLPTGTRAALQYDAGPIPVLAVRLQELFGQTDTPRIGRGRVPVLIHLLSPARRPLAVTQDLHSFWVSTYPTIRKQLRARYPKHVWPEDPLTASPTNRTRRSSRS